MVIKKKINHKKSNKKNSTKQTIAFIGYILSIFLLIITLMQFAFLSNPQNFNLKDSYEFYLKHPSIQKIVNKIHYDNGLVYVAIDASTYSAQSLKLFNLFTPNECLIQINPNSEFFLKFNNHTRNDILTLAYAHELGHCLNESSKPNTTLGLTINEANHDQETFSDVFAVLITLNTAENKNIFNQRMQSIYQFIEYRKQHNLKEHSTHNMLALLFPKLSYELVKRMSIDDIISNSHNYENYQNQYLQNTNIEPPRHTQGGMRAFSNQN